MRNRAGRGLAILWALLMMICGVSAEDAAEIVPALALPEAEGGTFALITPEEDPMIGPHEGNYLFNPGENVPYAYVDPSITVRLGWGRIYNTNYVYARVKIADPAQIRTMTSEKNLTAKNTVVGSLLAGRVKAVVAINGVLEADVSSESQYAFVDGPVVHQRVWKRPSEKTSEQKLANWRAKEGLDTLVIDDRGDFRIIEAAPWGEIQDEILAMGDSAVNVLTFGPALVVDGEPVYGYDRRQMSTHRPAQRMAICQTGELEYLLITSEGPEDQGSKGLKLDQFVELIASFPDVENAYNLDGGSSSTLVFRKGSENWAKVNCPKNAKKRGLRDLIYFADAWIPEGK